MIWFLILDGEGRGERGEGRGIEGRGERGRRVILF